MSSSQFGGRRSTVAFLLSVVLLVAVASLAGGARAAIEPPWCGTPEPDAAGRLPDGTHPGDPAGSFPHIPYYAIGCTLDSIVARSNGRMTVQPIGKSALGRDLYLVTINALDTVQQRQDYQVWQELRRIALTDPARARDLLDRYGDSIKIPLFIQAGIHGNEYEGVDASMQVIERLATTPYGADADVDTILDHAVVLFNIDQNPDGRALGQRANGFNFDLNRDYLTQSQSETKASVNIMQDWLPPDVLDLHGYVNPTLVEATTKPHNPSIEYDLWLKWNQARIDANEAAMNAIGQQIQRPINDWCSNADLPNPITGLCPDGALPGPSVAEGWDDWGPFYTAMYAQHVGLNASTVEMCSNTPCGGRIGSRRAQYTVSWSTLLFDVAHRHDLLADELEFYRRGVTNAPRPACCPPPFDRENNWMYEYPTAYVIPLGAGQRSDPEANRLVDWLLANGVQVEELKQEYTLGGRTFPKQSYVVWMTQARRGLVETALSIGVNVSGRIQQLYAPPGAWSHGFLWGADVYEVPRGASFLPQTTKVDKPNHLLVGGVEPGKADRYALKLDSPTAVRALNRLVGAGIPAQLALGSFADSGGTTLPAGSVLFPADPATKNALDATGKDVGVRFSRVNGPAPALDAIDRAPRIAVLTAAVNQDVWSLRDLGFTADPISTATLNTAPTDPLTDYDVIFNTGAYPSAANPVARTRLQAFFARGGGYIGAGANGGNFLVTGTQISGFTAATRTGNGRSGIIYWNNEGGAASPIVGAYSAQDTAIVDPPTWFTAVPATMTVDGRLPLTDYFAAGLWAADAQSASAAGSAVIAHGTTTAGTARIALFAMNPLYRADPEREWPAAGTAAYWADR
jgi:Zinc carboxypeptidase